MNLKAILDEAVKHYNQKSFIENDPICIPHTYSKKQDIEITAFWTAVLAWGRRSLIIKKCKVLFALMDDAPHDFILNHKDSDLKPFLDFKHRTFNATDTLYFIYFLRNHYQKYKSLEEAFTLSFGEKEVNVEQALINFHNYFFSLENAPKRTQKHIASPARKSACKRLNMFLRWMVRKDSMGVDFGIWDKIKTQQLVCPCDVHVERVARHFGLIKHRQRDWKMALELTENLKKLNPSDPVKYDFALFGLGEEGKF